MSTTYLKITDSISRIRVSLMKVSVLATCFNNERNVREFSSRAVAAVNAITTDFEVVIVDDGSTDSSWNIIRDLSLEFPQVRGIQLSRNFGQHPAILAGLDEVQGDFVVLMDSDLDDDPKLIPSLIQPILDGRADIVLTSQANLQRRRLSSQMFHALIQRATSSPRLPRIGTFRAFNSEVLSALRLYRDHSSVFGPLSTQIGFRMTYLEIPAEQQLRNPSNYNFRKRFRLSLPLLLNEANLPLKLVLGFTSATCLLVLGLGCVAVTRFVGGGGNISSTTSLVFLVIVLNQALLGLGIAVIAIYARFILRETLRRPRYHIAAKTSPSN